MGRVLRHKAKSFPKLHPNLRENVVRPAKNKNFAVLEMRRKGKKLSKIIALTPTGVSEREANRIFINRANSQDWVEQGTTSVSMVKGVKVIR